MQGSSETRSFFAFYQAGSKGIVYRQPEFPVSPKVEVPDGTHGADDRKDDESAIDLDREVNNVEDEEVSQESIQVKSLRSPSAPSRQEVLEHSLTHFPFRSWCPHCVKGKAKASKHSVTRGTE